MAATNEDDDVKQVVRALTKGAQEHGTPNSFAPSELALYGCRLSCLRVGQVALVGLNCQYTNRRFQLVLTSAEQLAILKTL